MIFNNATVVFSIPDYKLKHAKKSLKITKQDIIANSGGYIHIFKGRFRILKAAYDHHGVIGWASAY